MSRFFSEKYKNLTPYTPGEQPKDMKYIKLNTNESPFPPSDKAIMYAMEEAQKLQLYPDPECRALTEKVAELYGVNYDEVLMTNGSDEILNFAFMAFCDSNTPAIFPDISYGFYSVFAELNNVPYKEIPLKDDFSIDINDYKSQNSTIFIANPNAPTGMTLTISQIEEILKANRDNVVVIDEAYVDFGAQSCLPLVKKYDNLLVCQTFSKSRSMAGARLGFGVGNKELIADLNTVKYSTNPYNINRMTMAAGLGALADEEYTKLNCEIIARNRDKTMQKLKEMGFLAPESKSNFIFAKHEKVDGEFIYEGLKKKGILVRHFSKPRISDYIRITIGTAEQMTAFIFALKKVLEEYKC